MTTRESDFSPMLAELAAGGRVLHLDRHQIAPTVSGLSQAIKRLILPFFSDLGTTPLVLFWERLLVETHDVEPVLVDKLSPKVLRLPSPLYFEMPSGETIDVPQPAAVELTQSLSSAAGRTRVGLDLFCELIEQLDRVGLGDVALLTAQPLVDAAEAASEQLRGRGISCVVLVAGSSWVTTGPGDRAQDLANSRLLTDDLAAEIWGGAASKSADAIRALADAGSVIGFSPKTWINLDFREGLPVSAAAARAWATEFLRSPMGNVVLGIDAAFATQRESPDAHREILNKLVPLLLAWDEDELVGNLMRGAPSDDPLFQYFSAILALRSGAPDRAMRLLTDASTARHISVSLRVSLLHALSHAYRDRGLNESALAAMRTARKELTTSRSLGLQPMLALTLHNMAILFSESGRHNDALDLFREVVELEAELGDKSGEALASRQIAFILQDRSQFEEALRWHERSLLLDSGNVLEVARDHANIGANLMALGRGAEARGHLESALREFEALADDESVELLRRQLDAS